MSKSRSSLRRRQRTDLLVAAAATAAIWSLSGSSARAQTTYTFDPAKNGTTQLWDTTTVNWDSSATATPGVFDDTFVNGAAGTSVIAAFNSGAATTITTGAPITVNQIQFTGANANTTIAGTTNTITLAGTATNTIDVVTNGTGTINAVLNGTTGLTKTGGGILVLGGTNGFTGGFTITDGTASFATEANLGGGTVTLNGGALRYTGAAFTAAKTINIGASGGTYNMTANVKITASATNYFSGSGTLTRAGTTSLANNLSITGTNTAFTGGWNFTGGVTEVTSSGALGSGAATNTLTFNGGELAASGTTITQNIIINSGILGSDNGTSNFTGTVTVNGAFSIRLGDFYQATNRNMTISGPISGAGAFTLVNGAGTAATSGQVLSLNGNNSAYSTAISVPVGYNISFGTANSFGTGGVTVNTNGTAIGGIGVGYDFGSTLPTFTNTQTGNGGVFGINTTLAATTTVDLATLGGGTMFLGSQGTGIYNATTLGASGGTYRLGGGGGTLTLSNGVLVGNNAVVVGDSRVNGGGTIILAANNSYTGTTSVNAGTLQVGSGSTTGSLGTNTGTITLNGTLAFNRIDPVSLPNTLSGSGRLQQSAASTLTLTGSAANAIGGLTLNSNGVINIGSNNLGLGASNLINGSGGTINSSGGQILLNVANGDIGTSNGGTLTINAVIANGTQNSLDFFNTTNGNGVVVLTGNNTYTGTTNIQTGVISVSSLGSTGSPGNLGVNGTINLGNGTNTGVTLRYTGTGNETTTRTLGLVASTGAAIIDQSGTGLLKFAGTISVPGAASTDQRKTLTLQGSTSGTGEIASAISNSTAGTAGQLTTSVTKAGTGTWTLSGTNNYTGTTTVTGGTLILASPGSLSTSSPISLNGTGNVAFIYQGAATGSTTTVGAVTFAAGNGIVQSNYGISGNTSLTLASISRTAGATGTFIVNGGVNGTTNKIVVTSLGTTAGLLGPGLFFSTNANGSNSTYAYNDAGGFVRGLVYGTDSGTQIVPTGTTSIDPLNGVNALTQGTVTAQATATLNTLNVAGTDATAANNSITLASGATLTLSSILKTGNSAATISGGTGLSATSGGDLAIRVDGAGDSLTISSAILANGTNTLTKSGAGLLTLSNTANAFTGGINVTGGTLAFPGSAGATGDPLALGPGGKTITISNNAAIRPTSSANPTSSSTKGFVVGTGGATFDMPGGVTLTLDDGGQFSGTGDLTIIGGGTVSMTGQAYSFSGNVAVHNGTLRLGSNTVLGTATGRSLTVASGSVLEIFSTSANVPLTINLNGTGISNGGALVASAAAGTISSSIVLASDSSIGGSNTLTLNGPISGGFKVTKVGAGTTVLAGANSWSGGTQVNAGFLQFNGIAAVPSTGAITVATAGVVTVNNFSTADIANVLTDIAPSSTGVLALAGTSVAANVDLTNHPGLFLGATAASTYAGTYVPPAAGTANLGGGGGTLTFNQNLVSGSVTNVVIGNGTGTAGVVLNGTNTYTGSTTINAGGTLTAASDAALGASAASLVINGGALIMNGTGGNVSAGGRNTTLPGGATINIADAANSYTINTSGSSTGAITKGGPGTLTINGSLTTASNVTVGGGTVNFNGTVAGSSSATTLAFGAQAGNTIVNIGSGANLNLFQRQGANNASAVAVWNQTGGTVTVAEPTGDTGYVANLGYGYFNLSGGTFRDTVRFNVVAPTNFATGVAYIGNGGTLNNNNGDWMIIAYNGLGQMTVGPNGTLTRVGATSPLGIMLNKTNANGTLNVAGGTVDTGTQPIRFGNGGISSTTGFVNLAGGTLTVGSNASVSVGTAATNINNAGYYNFAGGTLKFSGALTTPIPATLITAGTTNFTSTATLFGPINNSAVSGAPSFNGGLTVDTNGFSSTIGVPLLAATGSGVTQANIAIPTTGNSGYVGAPAVTFSTTGVVAGGTPASGYALITGGAVTGIVITNPGTYTPGSTPSITLTGGGGTIASFNTTALNTANTSGGLTKVGAGTLTLTGSSTFTGDTTINQGTLLIDFNTATATSNLIAPTSALVLGGGTLQLTGKASTTNSQTFASLTLNPGSSVISLVANATANPLVLNLGAITRNPGGTIDFILPTGTQSATNGVTTTTPNDASGTLGPWATVNGGALAANDGSGNIVAYAGFTDIAARGPGSVIADGPTTNVRIQTAGTSGNVTLGSTVTTINSLTQNTTTASTIDTASGTLRVGATGSVTITTGNQALTIGTAANSGVLTAGGADDTAGELALGNYSANTLTVNAAITNNGTRAVTLAKAGTGLVVLTGTNSYSGPTVIGGGTLQVGAGGTTGTLGTNTGTIENDGTLVINRSNAFSIPNAITGTGGVSQLGTGVTTLSADSTYTGATTVGQGTLALTGGTQRLGALVMGATAGSALAGTLDLTGMSGDLTVGALTVQTNSAANVNTINIGSGRTLVATGPVSIGHNTTATTTTKLTVSGANGTLSIGTLAAATNASFQLGTATNDNISNAATLDMSGLGNFFANLGTGTFRVGDPTNGTGNASAASTLILAANSTIYAATFTSDSPAGNNTNAFQQLIRLGSGATEINANTIQIGMASNRANSLLNFLSPSSGTLQVRNQTTIGRAAMTVGYGNATTGFTPTAEVDLSNHFSNLFLSTLGIGGRTATSGGAVTGKFTFDTGILDVTGITVGDRRTTATHTGASTGTLNLNGGTVMVGASGITISTNTATLASNTTSGTVNLAGNADVTVGATSGTSIILGNAATAGNTATAVLSITGNASLSVAGDIVKGSGATPTAANSSLTLNGAGAVLDMNGRSIGSATAAINTLTFAAGTLMDVASINGTGTAVANGVTKTTSGVLTITGANGYTGPTAVSAGTLIVDGTLTSTTAVSVASAATLGGSSPSIAGPVTVAGGGTVAPGGQGNGVGKLTLTGITGNASPMLNATSTSNMNFDLTPTATPGSGHDQVVVTGITGASAVDLGQATLNLAGSANPALTYVLIDNQTAASITSTFSGLTEGALVTVGGSPFNITYSFDNGNTGNANDVALVPVPEPTASMVLAGVAGLGLLRRRRRAAR